MSDKKELAFSVVDAQKPVVPVWNEELSYSKTFVSYGYNNQYPEEVYTLYRNSTTLRSIVEGELKYVMGNGIKLNDELIRWYKVNKNGDTFEDLLSVIVRDYLIFGGYAIQVIYSKAGLIAELYPLDFKNIRSNKGNTKFWYSKTWTRYGGGQKAKVYDKFDRANFNPENPTQIFYYKNNIRNTYPVPSYEGAFADIATEIECSRYALNSVSNGFSARYVLNIPSALNLTDEQKESIERGIKEKFTGSNTNSNFLIYYTGDDGKELKVDALQSDDTAERFNLIKQSCSDSIFKAFAAQPLLFGSTIATGFSTDEFEQSFKVFNRTQIIPIQKQIINGFDKLFGIENSFSFLPFTLE